jgi:glycosyltransferase involved in cell wall biosynthesis
VIRRSAHIIVGNRILADYALKWNPNVSIIPTVVDTRQYWFKPVDSSHSRLTIGWIGSPSTSPYLTLIEPALRRLAAVHADKVQFRFCGDPEYRLNMPELSFLPFRLDHEIDDLHSFDVGLMPLSDTEWTRGKCAFKAIQYMAAGVPTVASPVGITTDLIQDGVNGFLASSAGEWFTALDRLVRDAELRRRVAVAARQTIEDSYSLDVWWPRFVALLDQLGERASTSQRETVAA